ncbi:hypothetical protein G9A89_009766 [Geosiphon pyriformis]|nr:hypothetical protein G9A89_009766 [Geosiphon pyriformis]
MSASQSSSSLSLQKNERIHNRESSPSPVTSKRHKLASREIDWSYNYNEKVVPIKAEWFYPKNITKKNTKQIEKVINQQTRNKETPEGKGKEITERTIIEDASNEQLAKNSPKDLDNEDKPDGYDRIFGFYLLHWRKLIWDLLRFFGRGWIFNYGT